MARSLWITRYAARSLRRHHRRNLITGSVLASIYAGILVFTGYVVWVEKFLRTDTVYVNQLGHLLVEHPGAVYAQLTKPQSALLTASDQAQVQAALAGDPAVAMIGRGLASPLLAVRGCRSRVVVATGRDMELEAKILREPEVQRWNAALVHPETLKALAALHARSPTVTGVMPSPDLSRRLNQQQEQDSPCQEPVPPDGSLQLLGRTIAGYTAASEAQIVGMQSTGLALLDSRTLYLPLSALQTLLETENVAYLSVFAVSLAALPGLYQRLSRALASNPSLVVQPFFAPEVGLYYTGSMAFLGAVASFFVLLVTAVSGLTLLSLYSITASERGSEMGMLLALGFPRRLVLHLFEREALLLTCLSLAGGLLLALLVGAAINLSKIPFAPPGIAGETSLTIAWNPAVMVLIALLLALASSLAVKFIIKRKLARTPVSLLQGAATL